LSSVSARRERGADRDGSIAGSIRRLRYSNAEAERQRPPRLAPALLVSRSGMSLAWHNELDAGKRRPWRLRDVIREDLDEQ
jgi:hypothetical protein